MSLHKFAEQVASKGRGDDSLLIHMTPDEVRNLQQFAQANGRSLTINPDTGLPEAGMLSDLFKAVAPIALGAFLGPAGLAFGGGMMSAGMAGLTVGGLTTLATGSLSRGLMAGLGAYGGAGLGESLMGAGTGALEAGAATAAQGQLGAANLALGEAMPSQVAQQFTQDSAARQLAAATPFDKMGAGLSSITSSPSAAGAFAKNNLVNLAAAASPIMAGAMVPTTTKMPVDTNPTYIRQKLYDPYTQTYKSLAPVKASEFGSRSFSDAYTNPQTGQMATLDQRQPTPMAGGGIVALARGGVPGYAVGGAPTILSDEALYQKTGSWEAAAAARDAQNNALNAFNNQQAADARDQAARASNIMADANRLKAATNTNAAAPVDYNALATNYVTTAAANPNITTADFISGANAANIGLTQPLATALDKSGLSLGSQYALTHANIGDAANAEETYGGLKGLSSNINYTLGAYNADAANKGKTGLQKQADALAALDKYGLNEADVKRATGKTIAELFPSTITKPVEVVPGGTQLPGATVYDNGAYGNYGSGPATGVDYRGNTVSIATPGDIITNPDGSSTVVPNIPGRPYGGFTGSEQVKSRYTAGGGSLGYTAKAPKDMDEFNQRFNKQTDDSLAAYNFLMGKGKNLTQANAVSNKPLMQPYFTGSNRYKPKFLSYGKDGEIVSSGASGATGDAKAAELTKAKTIEIVDSSGYNTETYTATLQEDGSYLAGNGKRYDVTGKQIAAGGGMMGYAMGGGLGSLGSYSDGGRLLRGPGDGVSDSIPATIGAKRQPARLADGEFVIPARIVSELGNGSTDAGAKKLYAMMDRVQRARGKTTGKNRVAANSRADKHLPA